MRAENVAALNGELAEISISTAEGEARAHFIRERLEVLARQLEIADRMEMDIGLRLPAAMEAVRAETGRLEELRARFGADYEAYAARVPRYIPRGAA